MFILLHSLTAAFLYTDNWYTCMENFGKPCITVTNKLQFVKNSKIIYFVNKTKY